MELGMYTGGPECNVKESICGSDSSITGDLTRKKQRLETQLSEVNAALDALKDNPELTKVLELVSKARR